METETRKPEETLGNPRKPKTRKRGSGEGSIFKRKDGRWVGMITIGYENGKRQRKTYYGADRSDVVRQLTDALGKHQRGEVIATGRQTVGEFMDQWLVDCVKPHSRPKTYASYEEQIRLHIKPALGHVLLRKLTGQQIQNFINRLAEKNSANSSKAEPKKLSARTVGYNLTVLRMALKQATEWRLIPFNPAANGIKRPKIERGKPETIDQSQALEILKAVQSHRLGPLFTLMLNTGLRRGEALGLRWEDVDLDGRKLQVRTTLQRINKKLVLGEPKTDRSRRTVLIPSSAAIALREHRTRQLSERLLIGPDWPDTGLVFTTEIGTPVDPRNAKRALDSILTAAKIPHCRLHDLRHACASLLLAQGVDLKMISEILGHSSIGVTADVYAHVSESAMRNAMDRLESSIGSAKS